MKFLTALFVMIGLSAFGQGNPSFKSFWTNQFSTNNLQIRLKSNAVYVTNINIDVFNTISNSIVNNFNTSITNYANTAIRDGVEVFPFALSNTAPTAAVYWMDSGRTNAQGQRLIYQSINATNGVMLWGLTNCQRWDLLSMNIVASSTNRWIYFPTNLPHFDTNGMTLEASRGWGLLLFTNHNLVFTLQSNALTMTTIWVTPEQ
jgi:hypothetical protein